MYYLYVKIMVHGQAEWMIVCQPKGTEDKELWAEVPNLKHFGSLGDAKNHRDLYLN